jgi:hypothetical protein
MSVCPDALSTREGALVSVSISVDPRHLEALLEALATLNFPINPQIYHDAAIVYRYPDRHQEAEPITLVDFPAYECRLGEVRAAIESCGFDPSTVRTTGMLEEIHSAYQPEPAPPGAPYLSRCRVKHRACAAG